MTVMSYIAYPTKLGLEQLCTDLKKINGVDIERSENKEVVIVVTTFESKDEEERIEKELKDLSSLQCLALVYAGNEEKMINEKLNN